MPISHLIKSHPDGTNLLLHGETPPISTLSPKILGLRTTKFSIQTSSNHKFQQPALQNLVLSEKERKDPSPKSPSEMPNKNLLLTDTTFKILMSLPEKAQEEEPLDSVGKHIKKILLTTEKMFTPLFKINKTHQLNTKVTFSLSLVR